MVKNKQQILKFSISKQESNQKDLRGDCVPDPFDFNSG